MRPRAALIAVAVLALGFGVGFYASERGGDERPVTTTAEPPPISAEPAEQAEAPEPPAAEEPEPEPAFAIARLPRSVRSQLRARGFWEPGCPVPLSGLRMLTVSYRGFDGRTHSGELVVNADAARPLRRVFRRLYRIRFPIRHIGFADAYGPRDERPREGDVTASFHCRQAVPSPCSGGTSSGNWSNHAYGLAVDLNPTENPYIGCGQSRDPATRPYRDRSRHRRGMVTPRVVEAFAAVGWEWGGAWAGDTKDYMHFSTTGH
jgi:hypothetical protein